MKYFGLLITFVIASGAAAKARWPFDPQRAALYTPGDLWAGYDSTPAQNKSLDWRIFEYFKGHSKYNPGSAELRAQRSHDAGMDLAVNSFLKIDEAAAPHGRLPIVVMGSHSVYRGDKVYDETARLGFALARAGYFVVTGGGPGLMEATHVGAYMAAYGERELADALAILATSSRPQNAAIKQYELADYWSVARKVTVKYPKGGDSLGIPTWFYGHEGANAFSGHVAKYFSNSLREEKLCSVGFAGVIFASGGPGTQQEVFMTAAENAYVSYNHFRPMIFFMDGDVPDHMTKLIEHTTSPGYREQGMLLKTTLAADVLKFLQSHPPIRKRAH